MIIMILDLTEEWCFIFSGTWEEVTLKAIQGKEKIIFVAQINLHLPFSQYFDNVFGKWHKLVNTVVMKNENNKNFKILLPVLNYSVWTLIVLLMTMM